MAFHFPSCRGSSWRCAGIPVPGLGNPVEAPAIPSGCQWGIFLRNHDELTLEMVTDEERDYMYAEYAKDRRMRANIGIRRRLAPLDNDRNQIELFTGLLLSLPGSPILYGDEIDRRQRAWLGDRDAVRTPMQWTPDRNAGFSSSDPGRLFLPTIMEPRLRLPGDERRGLHVLALVPAALDPPHDRDPASRTRPSASAPTRNSSPPTPPSSRSSRGPLHRGHEDDLVLCVHNFSRLGRAHRTRPAGLQRPPPGRTHRRGAIPGHRRAAVLAHPRGPRLLLVPAPQGRRLIQGRLQNPVGGAVSSVPPWARISDADSPVSGPLGKGRDVMSEAAIHSVTAPVARPLLASLDPLLREWLPRQRWFAGKGRPVTGFSLVTANELLPSTARRLACWSLLVRRTEPLTPAREPAPSPATATNCSSAYARRSRRTSRPR